MHVKPLKSILIAALFVISFVCAAALHADSKPDAASILTQYAKAVTNHDMKMIRELWASEDPAVSFYDSGQVYTGWKDVSMSYHTARLGELDKVFYEISDVVPHYDEHVTWATFKYKFSGRQPGQEALESQGVGTAILKREKKDWRILHIQQSNYPNKLKQVIIQQQ